MEGRLLDKENREKGIMSIVLLFNSMHKIFLLNIHCLKFIKVLKSPTFDSQKYNHKFKYNNCILA